MPAQRYQRHINMHRIRGITLIAQLRGCSSLYSCGLQPVMTRYKKIVSQAGKKILVVSTMLRHVSNIL